MKKLFLILAMAFLSLNIALAAPPPPDGGTGADCWPPSTCIPIDGGISLLLAAAMALGAKKLYDHKRTS